MTKGGKIGIGCLVVVVIVVFVMGTRIIGMYNSLVNLNENVTGAWAQVETNLPWVIYWHQETDIGVRFIVIRI